MRSDPAPDSSLRESPVAIRLTFSEAIDGSAAVTVAGASPVPVEGVGQPVVEGGVVIVALPELEPGLYTVSYQVTSALDGHVALGSFAFLVDPTGREPTPLGSAASSAPSTDAAAIAARWVALTMVLLAAGTLIAWVATVGPTLRALQEARVAIPGGVPWLFVGVSSVLASAGLAIHLALASRPLVVAGQSTHPGAAMLDTAGPFGWTPFAIAMRVAMLGTFAAFVVAIARSFQLDEARRRGRSQPWPRDWLVVAAAMALLALGSLGMSFASHATALGGILAALIDWLHLLAVAAWLGVLPALAVLALRARHVGSPHRSVMSEAIRRHWRTTLVAAPLVLVTGLANSPILLGDAREVVASEYGNLLLVKAALFSAAIAIGVATLLVARRGGPRLLVTLVAAQCLVAAVAVMTAAALVTTQPATARRAATDAARPVQLVQLADDLSVHLTVSGSTPGAQRYQVIVADADRGERLDETARVFLTFQPPASAVLESQTAELLPGVAQGEWTISGSYTPSAGDWQVGVTVRRPNAADERATFDFAVAEPVPPQGSLPPSDTGVGVPGPLMALWSVLPVGGPLVWILVVVLVATAAALSLDRSRQRQPALVDTARLSLVILALVAGLAAGSHAVVQAANRPPMTALAPNATGGPADTLNGERLFVANCASCHGASGEGDGPAASELRAAPLPLAGIIPRRTADELAYRIAAGLAGTEMPAFADSLTPAERQDLVAYLRSTWADPD